MSGTGAEKDNLTGVWHGQYAYPAASVAPVGFVATLIDFAGAISGTTHETVEPEEGGQATLLAMIEGRRDGALVSFVKSYSPAVENWQDVVYEGRLNGDATEIEGSWVIPGVWAGRFLMIRNRSVEAARSRRKRASV